MNITPSAMPRLVKCLGAVVLPNVDEEWDSTARGRALHDYLRRRALGEARDVAIAALPEEWRADAERMDVPEFVTQGRPEVGMALDAAAGTARLLGEDMTRESVRAARAPHEIGMLADWLAVEGDTVVVADYKAGWQEDLGPAAEHLQLLTYTAAALLALGKPYGRGELWHWDGVRWRVDSVTLGWLEAQEVLEEVRALLARANAAREKHAATGELPRLSRGRWCAWCPAQRACPALTGGLVALLKGDALPGPVVDFTPEQAGQAYELVTLLESRLDGLKADLRALAERNPLPLPGGKVLRLQEVERTSVDVDKAAPWLAKRYGDAVPQAAEKVTRSMSWESLTDALRVHVLPGLLTAHAEGRLPGKKPTLARLKEEARSGLEAVGAVKVSVHAQVRACVPELPADAQPPEPGSEG